MKNLIGALKIKKIDLYLSELKWKERYKCVKICGLVDNGLIDDGKDVVIINLGGYTLSQTKNHSAKGF